MKPETYVCIVPSCEIPKGSRAIKLEKNYAIEIDGVRIGILLAPQIEQNPECWEKEKQYKRGEGWEIVNGKVVHVEHPLDKRFVMMKEKDARKQLFPEPLPRPDGKPIGKVEYFENADGDMVPVTTPVESGWDAVCRDKIENAYEPTYDIAEQKRQESMVDYPTEVWVVYDSYRNEFVSCHSSQPKAATYALHYNREQYLPDEVNAANRKIIVLPYF